MTARRILTLFCAAFVLTEARWLNPKREVASICNPQYSNSGKILCYCTKDSKQPELISSADCFLNVDGVKPTDKAWDTFEVFELTTKLTLTNTRGISLPYVPSQGLSHFEGLEQLEIKYGNIEKIHAYAFLNTSTLKEISLKDSQIKILEPHSFARLRELREINLDKNNIVEINREVFMDLPSLEKLFLTSNQITTIHDRAFLDLGNLKELEVNMNKLFSLNSETFSGLKKLQKLDLSSNSLEVIGDNTFLPLKNLQSLILESNKIQMLDGKAFHGLNKLQYLSLAHNHLSNIENVNTFERLDSLKTLSLRANEIKALDNNVMAPLMNNFYAVDSHLDVEDNNFPCDCRLEWFIQVMNHTQSANLKIALENLKCIPDTKLRETWSQLEEPERTSGQEFEAQDGQANDYEYYDETQLNGKLFYTDIRDLINCTKPRSQVYTARVDARTKAITSPTSTPITTKSTRITTKATTAYRPPTTNKLMTPSMPAMPSSTYKPTTEHISRTIKQSVTSHGLLDLSADETTPKYEPENNEIGTQEHNKKANIYTTTRLATVSAKPYEKSNVYEDMASDEAKPDKLKAQRSIEDEYKGSSNGHKIYAGCVVSVVLICLELFH